MSHLSYVASSLISSPRGELHASIPQCLLLQHVFCGFSCENIHFYLKKRQDQKEKHFVGGRKQ